MKKLKVKVDEAQTKILSEEPLSFTVSLEEMERYGWSSEQQLQNNPSLMLERLLRKTYKTKS
jgi:hypothetical protein